MRFNKTIFVLSLTACLSLSQALQPVHASESNKSAGNKAESNKNEGRKLSMTFPGIGTANITVAPAQVKPLAFGKALAPGRHLSLGQSGANSHDKKDLSIESNGNNITVRVPASIDAAIDDAQVVSRQVGRYASSGMAGATRFIDLVVLYFKQWSGTTTITPGGFPYVDKSASSFGPAPTTIASGHKLYFTGEGRLKSVVSR